MKKIAVAFTGRSNSGKTTVIEKISKILLSRKEEVIIVKNDPKDKAKFDVDGKDSDKFFKTGADVFVVSPTRTTLFSHKKSELENLIEMKPNFDFLLVEGLKHLPLPRIAVIRGEADESYFPFVKAVAIDESVDKSRIPADIDILDLNSPEEIILWIEQNGEKID
ncbi:molybdopterin-guanine dinucleotide biosynthesis protein MobB [Thiovulum sp. ES]|nr:molybdopterin-guanine dinucleotide biosynthesis protein MobB [Thiovulum sp. ES]